MVQDTRPRSSDPETEPRPSNNGSGESISSLLGSLRHDVSTWARRELELARREVACRAEEAGRDVLRLAAGLVALVAGGLFLLVALSLAIAAFAHTKGLDAVSSCLVGFSVVGLFVTAIGAVVAILSKKKLSRSGILPDRTARSIRETKNWAKEKIQ